VYAVIDDGQKQYRVEQGTRFEVQLKDLEEGQDKYVFDRVLMVGGEGTETRVGTPTVAGASVTASILGEVKGDKITVLKFRRRKNYHRKAGHRQRYLQVQVDSINV